MKPCWNTHAALRPSFADVIEKIEMLFIGGAAGDDYDYDVTKEDDNAGYVNVRALMNNLNNPEYMETK